MGECSDFHVGEPIYVTVPFDPPHRITVPCAVRYVWDEFIDVELGDTALRFPRQVVDCSGLEVGEACEVRAEDFDQHFSLSDYDPDEEASDGA